MADNRIKCCCSSCTPPCGACYLNITFSGVNTCSCLNRGSVSYSSFGPPSGTVECDNSENDYDNGCLFTGYINSGGTNSWSENGCTGTEYPPDILGLAIVILVGKNISGNVTTEIWAFDEYYHNFFYGNQTSHIGNGTFNISTLGNQTFTNQCTCGGTSTPAFYGTLGSWDMGYGGNCTIGTVNTTCCLAGKGGNCSDCGNYTLVFTPISGGSSQTYTVTRTGPCSWSSSDGNASLYAEYNVINCGQWTAWLNRVEDGAQQFANCCTNPCPPEGTYDGENWNVSITKNGDGDALINKYLSSPKQFIDSTYIPTAANSTKGRCCT